MISLFERKELVKRRKKKIMDKIMDIVGKIEAALRTTLQYDR